MVWKGLDACGQKVAAQAQLNWNGGGKELLLQGGVQTAHVAQPVWLELQHLLCFLWCIHLQQAPFAGPAWPGFQDYLTSNWPNDRRLKQSLRGKARQGRTGQAQHCKTGRAGHTIVGQGRV